MGDKHSITVATFAVKFLRTDTDKTICVKQKPQNTKALIQKVAFCYSTPDYEITQTKQKFVEMIQGII